MYAATIEHLSDFFAVFHFLLRKDEVFWFRGHSDLAYQLVPSALRYAEEADRERALGLYREMRRFLEIKLAKPPRSEEILKWVQVAQHHGLPTRLLDWTQNAAVALYFACCSNPDRDGLVVVLSPLALNRAVDPRSPRIFNEDADAHIVQPYFDLRGREEQKGKPTIAINPTWTTERIVLQQGSFTLHGSKAFALDADQAPGLLYVPVLKEHKENLRYELQRVGIGEMFIFPEPEHVCNHLKRDANL